MTNIAHGAFLALKMFVRVYQVLRPNRLPVPCRLPKPRLLVFWPPPTDLLIADRVRGVGPRSWNEDHVIAELQSPPETCCLPAHGAHPDQAVSSTRSSLARTTRLDARLQCFSSGEARDTGRNPTGPGVEGLFALSSSIQGPANAVCMYWWEGWASRRYLEGSRKWQDSDALPRSTSACGGRVLNFLEAADECRRVLWGWHVRSKQRPDLPPRARNNPVGSLGRGPWLVMRHSVSGVCNLAT